MFSRLFLYMMPHAVGLTPAKSLMYLLEIEINHFITIPLRANLQQYWAVLYKHLSFILKVEKFKCVIYFGA